MADPSRTAPRSRRRRILTAAALGALAVLGVSCGGDGGGEPLVLDGSPRLPDDEGIATTVEIDEIVLGGDRAYRVSRDLISFRAPTRSLVPVRQLAGEYVQVGLDGDVIVWIGSLGDVTAGDEPRAFHAGRLVDAGAERLVFDGGLVLRLAQGVSSPVAEGAVVVVIDASAGRVAEITPS